MNFIISALREIEGATCVRFRQETGPNNRFISITNNVAGCFSSVGFQWYASQQLNLGTGCMRRGTIMHEFLHALGFYHQQNSDDRDSFVHINLKNVRPGQENNFAKYTNSEVSNYGFQYDYGSIMHYGAYDFSINGEPTILVRQSGVVSMGQREKLSPSDIGKINKMYNCY